MIDRFQGEFELFGISSDLGCLNGGYVAAVFTGYTASGHIILGGGAALGALVRFRGIRLTRFSDRGIDADSFQVGGGWTIIGGRAPVDKGRSSEHKLIIYYRNKKEGDSLTLFTTSDKLQTRWRNTKTL